MNVAIAVSVAAVIIGPLFLVAVGVAVFRRRGGRSTGPREAALVTFLGGLTLGILGVVGSFDLLVAGPILVAAAIAFIGLFRRRRRVQAGWLLVGTALPWTVLWAAYLGAFLLNVNDFDPGSVWKGFAAGAIPTAIGLALVWRGDPDPPPPSPRARAGDPGSRSFGTISEAIREPGIIGPIGISELASLLGFILAWTIIPLALPAQVPQIAGFLLSVVVGSVLATELYIRAMPSRSRRAMEAFSWLGEWELKRLGLSPFRVPTTRAGAVRWLASHPEGSDPPAFRAELLVLAERYEDARAVVEQMPIATPLQRWERAEASDSVYWRAGGDGDVAGMNAAAADLLPSDGDERMRAEVSIATAKVRRRMADGRATPGDAVDPLLEVRERLGARADGQVGRAIRRRLFLVWLAASVVFGGLFELVGPLLFPVG
jgi:PAS domain-containing protein